VKMRRKRNQRIRRKKEGLHETSVRKREENQAIKFCIPSFSCEKEVDEEDYSNSSPRRTGTSPLPSSHSPRVGGRRRPQGPNSAIQTPLIWIPTVQILCLLGCPRSTTTGCPLPPSHSMVQVGPGNEGMNKSVRRMVKVMEGRVFW